MPAREYEVVPVDSENIEDGVKNAKLAALRAQGYRVVSSLGVQHRGRPCLALVLEPPLAGEEPKPEPPPPVAVPPVAVPPAVPTPRFTTRDWIILALGVVVVLGQVIQLVR